MVRRRKRAARRHRTPLLPRGSTRFRDTFGGGGDRADYFGGHAPRSGAAAPYSFLSSSSRMRKSLRNRSVSTARADAGTTVRYGITLNQVSTTSRLSSFNDER